MQVCNKWGQGQLFTFSGLSGETDTKNGLCGYLLGDKPGIQFVYPARFEVFVSHAAYASLVFTAVTGDRIEAQADGKKLSFLMADAYTLVGTVPDNCRLALYDGEVQEPCRVTLLQQNGRFALAVGQSREQADRRARAGLKADLTGLAASLGAFYRRPCPRKDYEDLYAKCLSVMRTQVCTPEGAFTTRWSTPDRFPHRHAWLWDSCFHAIGFRHVDPALAEELLEAAFTCQRPDGFVPHAFSPGWSSSITQPPVVAYAARKVCEMSGNKAFLQRIYEKNGRFLAWCDANRRVGPEALYTWHQSEDALCRCDESGMDNSTRFDTVSRLYAIDFSCFYANEMRHMSAIASELGRPDEARCYAQRYEAVKEAVNRVLWDKDNGYYTDYDVDNKQFHSILSVASFLPLLAGICDEEKAARMVRALNDPDEFGTALPVPSLPRGSDYFGDDMWRGPVWINYNYLIAEGLREYGYSTLADSLKEKTLEAVAKYYRLFGTYYEFYDSTDTTPPFLLNRKGPVMEPYAPCIRAQAIRDYGWTGTLVFDWLNTGNTTDPA